ncbi:MAG: hypothetical protein KGP35_05340 [Bacteroidetes bacterium]|nr:hypothetical protein [Bacteroidota bacterium]
MQKIIFSIFLFAVLSCTKEKAAQQQNQCNCGTIANDGIDNGCYWLEIRNNCSGNKKKFCFDQDIWLNAQVGTNFCVTNQQQW